MNNNVLNKGNKQEIHESLKRRQEKSISRKIKSSSITKSDNLKIKINSAEIVLNTDVKKNDKDFDNEKTKIKILEEKISDLSEKEEFSTLIKFAKKGDRVGFLNTMER